MTYEQLIPAESLRGKFSSREPPAQRNANSQSRSSTASRWSPGRAARGVARGRSPSSTRRLMQCYPTQMAWFFIICADVFEVAWPFLLKWSAPLSRWAPLYVVIICAIPANFLLAEAVKRLPAATVYATFVGIGTAGTAIVGMAFCRESTNLGRVCSLLLIAVGLIGLRIFSGAE
jgi:quaternary ammonium compound-resistance protein SugE